MYNFFLPSARANHQQKSIENRRLGTLQTVVKTCEVFAPFLIALMIQKRDLYTMAAERKSGKKAKL